MGFPCRKQNLFVFEYPLKLSLFYFILFRGIMKQFGNHVARIAVVFMIFGTGMFISAAGMHVFEHQLSRGSFIIKNYGNTK